MNPAEGILHHVLQYANHKIASINPGANIIVTPADHLILKENIYQEKLTEALEYAANNDALVTIGIHPNRPDTGYGYIQYDAKETATFKKVIQFTEKPNFERAESFVKSGNYSWNSGMFIWTLKSIQKAMKNHLPEVQEIFEQGNGKYNTEEETEFINNVYKNCPDISIDYGVMEKAENVHVINADFGWSDLGTWGSLYTHIEADGHGNAVVTGKTMLYDAADNIIKTSPKKMTILQGLTGYIVVDTDNALLVCKKQDEQKIKQFVNDLGKKGETEYL